MITVTYVTMMYGLGLPILFPIAFLTFMVMLMFERYHLAYTFYQPPVMCAASTDRALALLSYTPFILLANGFWMLSNRQMFENVVNQITYSNSNMPSAHTLSTSMQANHATPIALIAFFLLFLAVIRHLFPEWMKQQGFTISSVSLKVKENLPNFFKALKSK